MKKLIDKLEVLKRVSPSLSDWGEGYTSGVMDALQIVRAHNPWHVAKDGLPEPDKLLWFLCSDGSVFLGYYLSYIEDNELNYYWAVLDNNCITYEEGNEIIVQTVFDDDYDVTHYRYIPTDLPELPK